MTTIREIIESGARNVDIKDAAEIAGMSEKMLRDIIQQGNCPFGMYSAGQGFRKCFRVPALKFVNWMCGTHYFDIDEARKNT